VLLILIILFVTIFFCHGLIRLCMLVVKNSRNGGVDDDSRAARVPQMFGPGGYAIPRQPIRVVLARDEEAAGIESETTKINPPAYGLWRESVVCLNSSGLVAISAFRISFTNPCYRESIPTASTGHAMRVPLHRRRD